MTEARRPKYVHEDQSNKINLQVGVSVDGCWRNLGYSDSRYCYSKEMIQSPEAPRVKGDRG